MIYLLFQKLIAIFPYKYGPKLALTVSSNFRIHQLEQVKSVVFVLSLFLTLLLLQSTLQTDFPPSITMHKAIALLAIFMVVAALANGAPMP